MEMCYFWLLDGIINKQFSIAQDPDKENLADYSSKAYPAAHNRLIGPFFTHQKSHLSTYSMLGSLVRCKGVLRSQEIITWPLYVGILCLVTTHRHLHQCYQQQPMQGRLQNTTDFPHSLSIYSSKAIPLLTPKCTKAAAMHLYIQHSLIQFVRSNTTELILMEMLVLCHVGMPPFLVTCLVTIADVTTCHKLVCWRFGDMTMMRIIDDDIHH